MCISGEHATSRIVREKRFSANRHRTTTTPSMTRLRDAGCQPSCGHRMSR
ncbi:hypothetical protein D805_0269 [Bifidobacterium thermophilum RBL67]|uniref:Uncharacterized protein n=1 Tax=Bifidobacterium thermophilum RBL67 TaxID=1254439 RepID=M4RAQ4_9BIFI|nr:hypothetical protein D805_0269 [Bifidobacterium thermophilum RBL67]